MSKREIAAAIMALPEEERLDLARRIVADTLVDPAISAQVAEAIQGIEDVVTAKVRGLTEAEFRQALE